MSEGDFLTVGDLADMFGRESWRIRRACGHAADNRVMIEVTPDEHDVNNEVVDVNLAHAECEPSIKTPVAKAIATGQASRVVYSSHTSSNADLIAEAADLYIPDGATVADVTYGRGVFWRRQTRHQCTLPGLRSFGPGLNPSGGKAR